MDYSDDGDWLECEALDFDSDGGSDGSGGGM